MKYGNCFRDFEINIKAPIKTEIAAKMVVMVSEANISMRRTGGS